jgi:hypothetical protein
MTNPTRPTITVQSLVENATRLGKGAQHVALAAAFCKSLSGTRVLSICVWCADARHGWTGEAFRLPRGGECQCCPYVGVDTIVLVNPA